MKNFTEDFHLLLLLINGLTARTQKPAAQAIMAKLTVNLVVELIGFEPMTTTLQG